MDFKSLLSQLDQLNEAKEKTKTGLKHTAEPGGYGRKDDEDDEGHKVKSTAVKKGKGRPKKDADDSGETKKYDFSAFGVKSGKDVKLPKHDKKKTTVVKGKSQSHADNKKDDGTDPEEHKTKAKKKGLKEYFDALDRAIMNEAEQIQIKPASQMPKQPGQTSMGQKPAVPGQPQQVAGQPAQNTQVIAQGNKTLGTVNNPQLAQQIKQSIGKGEMTLMPDQMHEEQLNELSPELLKRYQAQADRQFDSPKGKKRIQGSKIADYKLGNRFSYGHTDSRGDKITARRNAKIAAARAAGTLPPEPDFDPSDDFTSSMPPIKFGRMYGKTNEEDMGKHNNATTGFDALVRKLTPKYGAEAAKRIAGAQLKKIREADQPPNDSLMSPMSETRAKADNKAEKAGKKVTKDLEYDMYHKGKDDNKAEKAGKKVTKDIEYDEKHKTNEAKKPDANKNGIPDYAEDGKGKNDLKKKKDKIDEGMMDNIKGMLVPKLMKLLGPEAEQIASAVKQATGGDFTPSKENAMKVVQALGIDKAAAQGQSQQMAEGIAGNWQGKLIQALYTLGLLGSASVSMWSMGPGWGDKHVASGLITVIGVVLLMFANTFFSSDTGMVGAMGKHGNKGFETNKGPNRGASLEEYNSKMTIRNTNVDESTSKKKVKEGMEHKLKAARHTGKAHALSKQAYNCNYDDMEESRHYHEGFKEGLDECYGQMPIQGYVGENSNELNDMASYGAHTPTMEDEMDEGNAFTDKLRKTPAGGKFSVGGNTYTDRSSIEESPFAFEAWEKELNSILEGKEVTEGMTVSISKGQQGSPDSVSVSAQDSEADQLLSIIKSAGLGLFGGDDVGQPQTGQPMTVDVDGGEGPQADIEVVDDHDDMLSLIRKMTGQGPAQSAGDYEDEGGHDEHEHEEETCNECGGMMEEGHACGEAVEEDEIDDGEAVEEDETMDQREYEVAEAEEVVNNNDEAEEEQSDATRDASLAAAAGQNFADTDAPIREGGDGGEAGTDAIAADDAADEVDAEEEDLDESLANGADDTFESDIDFMTNVISGGLNKRKSTGQTTIPVVSTQVNRLGSPMKESTDLLHDWKKLSGIK